MEATYDYAIITVKHKTFGEMDIRVSRNIPVKEIIHNLFGALSCDRKDLRGYYLRAEFAQVLLNPYETLAEKEIYDGDILHIL